MSTEKQNIQRHVVKSEGDPLVDSGLETRLLALHGDSAEQLLDRLRVPVQTAAVVGGKLQVYERQALQFFRVWAETPDLLISEEDLVKMTAYVYAEVKYLTEWENDGQEPGPTQWFCLRSKPAGYVYEGLNALFQLFAEETRRNASFRMLAPQAFPQAINYPAGTFKPGERVATFRDWQKGFCIALRKFGEEHLADINSEDAVGLFVRDKEFLTDYAKALETARPTLAYYRWFARLWDKFYLPLRFWKKTPAWNFMHHKHHYDGDEKDFTRNFYSQKADPKNKRAPSLVGLKPHAPEVVVKWEGQRVPHITISAEAAEHHNLLVERCIIALEQTLKANVKAK